MFHKQYWTKYTVPGHSKGDGWGTREGYERIVLKSAHGKWMSADGEKLRASVPQERDGGVGPWEKFTPIPQGGNVVSLLSDHGKYVEAMGNGEANANGTHSREFEKFYVYKCHGEGSDEGKNCLAFKSLALNKFLVAEPDGTVNCNRDACAAWEKWYGWENYPNDDDTEMILAK